MAKREVLEDYSESELVRLTIIAKREDFSYWKDGILEMLKNPEERFWVTMGVPGMIGILAIFIILTGKVDILIFCGFLVALFLTFTTFETLALRKTVIFDKQKRLLTIAKQVLVFVRTKRDFFFTDISKIEIQPFISSEYQIGSSSRIHRDLRRINLKTRNGGIIKLWNDCTEKEVSDLIEKIASLIGVPLTRLPSKKR